MIYWGTDEWVTQTAGHYTQPMESTLPWSTYRCDKCKGPINAVNSNELYNWLAERNMLSEGE